MERIQAQTLEKQKAEVRAYDWDLDRQNWAKIKALEGQIPPAEFAQKVLDFQREILINLETDLGERFNAQLFEVYYPLENGRIMHPRKHIPFLDSLIEGQQHRLGGEASLNHNQKRELAEIVSFSAIEQYCANNPDSNKSLVNSSPQGGDYHSKFVDTFDLIQNSGRKFVRMRRFAVSSTLDQYRQNATDLTENQIQFGPDTPTDITLKGTVIRTSKSAEEILNIYIPDKKAMTLKEYEKLKNKCKLIHNEYIEALMQDATSEYLQSIYKDLNRFADIQRGITCDLTGQISKGKILKEEDLPFLHLVLSSQPLREVRTGCGIQGGQAGRTWDLTSENLFNLNTFNTSSGEDQYGTLEIHCEECGATYDRTPGKLEEKCRRCGGKKGIVC